MIESLVRRYQRRGILVDANLLLGYLVGRSYPQFLDRCRATTSYFGAGDFPLLNRFLGEFSSIVTTPHILTEVSNLAGRLPLDLHRGFRAEFRAVISVLVEEQSSAREITESAEFVGFGLTDAAISILATRRHLILTDENALYGFLSKRGRAVIDFNDIKRMAASQ